jgi:hypothetical protein
MLRTRLLSAPPAIAIDDEPLVADHSDWVPISVEGFELVPAWQARPARARRRVLATVPVLAVAAAVAISVGPRHGATPIRAGAVKPAAPSRPALVVQASPAPAIDVSRARR